MGKFGANRGGGGFRRNNGGGGDRNESRGGSSRGGFNRGGNRGGGKSRNNDNSMKLGDISVSEKVVEELGEETVESLREANIGMYVKIYPPKGVDEITIRRGDYLNIRLCKGKHGGERTVGFITVSSSDE